MKTIELTKKELKELLEGKEVVLSESTVLKKKGEWQPSEGKCLISATGKIIRLTQPDNEAILFGTHRKTYDESVKARKAMCTFNRLLAYRDEFDPDYEFTVGGDNSYISFNYDTNEYDYFWNQSNKNIGNVYMSTMVARELCRKLNRGEVVL